MLNSLLIRYLAQNHRSSTELYGWKFHFHENSPLTMDDVDLIIEDVEKVVGESTVSDTITRVHSNRKTSNLSNS